MTITDFNTSQMPPIAVSNGTPPISDSNSNLGSAGQQVSAGFPSGGFQPPSPPSGGGVFVPQEKHKGINKNLIVVGILVLGLAGGILGVSQFTSLFSKASGQDCAPIGLHDENRTTNSVEIVFSTVDECKVKVAYGIKSGASDAAPALLLEVKEPEDTPSTKSHRLRLSYLMAGTTYNYQVAVGDRRLGEIKSFTTLPAQTPVSPSPQPTVPPAVLSPTTRPTIPASGGFTLDDFEAHFGGDRVNNPERYDARFDIDNNGFINQLDWLFYQRSQSATSTPAR